MPFIAVHTSVKLTPELRETVKNELGRLLPLMPGRQEKHLMVEFLDGVFYYLAGQSKEKAAFIELRLLGRADEAGQEAFVTAVLPAIGAALDIPVENIYLNIIELPHWGARGTYETAKNF